MDVLFLHLLLCTQCVHIHQVDCRSHIAEWLATYRLLFADLPHVAVMGIIESWIKHLLYCCPLYFEPLDLDRVLCRYLYTTKLCPSLSVDGCFQHRQKQPGMHTIRIRHSSLVLSAGSPTPKSCCLPTVKAPSKLCKSQPDLLWELSCWSVFEICFIHLGRSMQMTCISFQFWSSAKTRYLQQHLFATAAWCASSIRDACYWQCSAFLYSHWHCVLWLLTWEWLILIIHYADQLV